MMVRGGDASEAAIAVDGLTLQNPSSRDVPGVQQRSRFGAFQFEVDCVQQRGLRSARYGRGHVFCARDEYPGYAGQQHH